MSCILIIRLVDILLGCLSTKIYSVSVFTFGEAIVVTRPCKTTLFFPN